ncbi:MAG: hypothetical protein RL297_932 [Pseudomonadota bacterium]|jgi:hypothetical protein
MSVDLFKPILNRFSYPTALTSLRVACSKVTQVFLVLLL